jgi:crotonobetainyl-CoA:carnitine CoA-transferase CaiB-like acyl-CoA transferase
MSLLLEGIRVLESAVLFNGDSVGMILGDLGADVIKLESPGKGDYIRHFLGQLTPGNSPAHLQVNKNKRSLALDLRSEKGKEIFFRLVATADVFVDGFIADTCDRMGIGYEAQRAVKPDIIYCQYTGFGARGPYARIPTHGQMMNALAAATPQERGPDGLARPADASRPLGGMASAGEGTAVGAPYAALAAVAAIVRRVRTGEGAKIDVAASDAVFASAWTAATYSANLSRVPEMASWGAHENAKYAFYETRDGKFVLFCAIEPKFWQAFCRAVGRPDLVDRHDRDAAVDFGRRDESLRAELRAVIAERTLDEWTALAAANDLPIGPAHRFEDVLADEHVRSRRAFVDDTHPEAGPFTYLASPVQIEGEDYAVRRHAPALGEHTREILREIGLDDAEIEALRADGVV